MAPRKEDDGETKGKRKHEQQVEDENKVMDTPSPAGNTSVSENVSGDDSDIDVDLIDNISPAKELNDALNGQRESEKQAFDILIKENVILERGRKKDEEKYQQLLAKYEVKTIELTAEQAKTDQLQRKLGEMKTEMTGLIRASNKQGIVGKVPGKGKHKSNRKADKPSGDYLSESEDCVFTDNEASEAPKDDTQYALSTKLRDLELRLLRLTEEDERKSRMLVTYQKDLANSARYIEQLEKHVDDKVREDLSNEMESAGDGIGFTTVGKPTNAVYRGKPQAYSYKKNIAKDSVVCVIS